MQFFINTLRGKRKSRGREGEREEEGGGERETSEKINLSAHSLHRGSTQTNE